MNPDDGSMAPFEKYSTMRLLVRGKVIFCILVNWNELKAYFLTAQQASTQAACFKACILMDMLNNPIVYLYFHFGLPLVTEFDRVNSFFQAKDADRQKKCSQGWIHTTKV